jgi:hypothetical protein
MRPATRPESKQVGVDMALYLIDAIAKAKTELGLSKRELCERAVFRELVDLGVIDPTSEPAQDLYRHLGLDQAGRQLKMDVGDHDSRKGADTAAA